MCDLHTAGSGRHALRDMADVLPAGYFREAVAAIALFELRRLIMPMQAWQQSSSLGPNIEDKRARPPPTRKRYDTNPVTNPAPPVKVGPFWGNGGSQNAIKMCAKTLTGSWFYKELSSTSPCASAFSFLSSTYLSLADSVRIVRVAAEVRPSMADRAPPQRGEVHVLLSFLLCLVLLQMTFMPNYVFWT